MTDLNDADFSSLSFQFQEATSYAVQLTLIEYCLMVLLSFFAIPLLCYFLWVAQLGHKHLSVQLQINIGIWLFYMLTAILYALPMLTSWKGQGEFLWN